MGCTIAIPSVQMKLRSVEHLSEDLLALNVLSIVHRYLTHDAALGFAEGDMTAAVK